MDGIAGRTVRARVWRGMPEPGAMPWNRYCRWHGSIVAVWSQAVRSASPPLKSCVQTGVPEGNVTSEAPMNGLVRVAASGVHVPVRLLEVHEGNSRCPSGPIASTTSRYVFDPTSPLLRHGEHHFMIGDLAEAARAADRSSRAGSGVRLRRHKR
nr:hypothetical protein [Actinospica durhamensis]